MSRLKTLVRNEAGTPPQWLRPRKRFAHLFAPGAGGVLSQIQTQVDEDWAALLARCGSAPSAEASM